MSGVLTPLLLRPPVAGDPERGALPLHLRAAASALFDDLPSPRREAAGAAAEEIDRVRAQLATRLPAGTELTVDAYRVRLVAACPASAAGRGADFRWSPATAARHLGLRALALHLCGSGRPIAEAVRAVLAEHVDHGGERSPGPWLASLPPAGRAVAEAQARLWAEQASAWLPLRLVDPRGLRFLDDDWWPGGARGGRGGRTLVVHGRRDVTVTVGRARVAVTVAGGTSRTPGLADADALTALAASLCDPRARVVRVVRVHPSSGDVVAADVDDALLRRGVDVVLATADALVAASAGDEPQAAPGPGCTWCDRRSACGPGQAWLARPQRRSMGLPIGAGTTSG